MMFTDCTMFLKFMKHAGRNSIFYGVCPFHNNNGKNYPCKYIGNVSPFKHLQLQCQHQARNSVTTLLICIPQLCIAQIMDTALSRDPVLSRVFIYRENGQLRILILIVSQ